MVVNGAGVEPTSLLRAHSTVFHPTKLTTLVPGLVVKPHRELLLLIK